MKNLLIIHILPFLLLLFIIDGCSIKKSIQGNNSKNGITIYDALNRKVHLKKSAMRIASLSPGLTNALFAVGCGKQVILRDKRDGYSDEIARLPAVDSLNPLPENIAAYRPDLVILYFSDDRFVKNFNKIGINVAVFNPVNYREVTEDIKKIGILCGQSQQASVLANKMIERKEAIIKKIKNGRSKRIYIEIDSTDSARPWTAGKGSFVDELVSIAGGENVFSNLSKSYAQVNLEDIIRSEAECILLAGQKKGSYKDALLNLSKRPGMGAMNAVIKGQVIGNIDRDLLTLTGPGLAEGLELLYKNLWVDGSCAK